MNWILNFIFLAVFSLQALLLGKPVLKLFGYQNRTLMKSWIAGTLCFFLILYLPGELAYWFHLSWTVYFWLTLSLVLITDLFVLAVQHAEISEELRKWKNARPGQILNSLRRNWAGILFVFLFLWFAVSSNQPFLSMNYDDPYYIGKVVHLIGADRTFTLDYYTGAAAGSSSELFRALSVYEIAYAWLASLFHIDPVFFCRVSAAMLTYILFYFSLVSIARYFVRPYLAQYAAAGFLFFLIPLSYYYLNLNIYSYDFWQFSLAAYYGSSVVRMCALPVLFLFGKDLFRKFSLKKTVFLLLISLAFLSFSSVYVSIALFALCAFILTWLICAILRSAGQKKWIPLLAAAIAFALLSWLLVITKQTDLDTERYTQYVQTIQSYAQRYYSNPALLYAGLGIPVAGLLINWKKKSSVLFILTLCLMALIFPFQACALNYELSFHYTFVYQRAVAAFQYLIVFEAMLVILPLIGLLRKKAAEITGFLFYAAAAACSLGLFFSNQSWFTDRANIVQGTGVSLEGWDFSRILNFDETMKPDSLEQIGAYLDSLPYRIYSIAVPGLISDGEEAFDHSGMMLASNRSSDLLSKGRTPIPEEDADRMLVFLNSSESKGESQDAKALELLKQYQFDFVGANEGNAQNLLQNDPAFEEVLRTGEENGSGQFVLFRRVS